ncbi:E3 ubiquitin-protein ligase TRIM7-like isoform X4 [Anas platyrhynchos]|uniref:E3 ubiquitin-protein ligase TRIM7-like isoform X4 n=1 Tax=Anas platyrhynchos TaxID=8839 RepID=UPI003AF29C63
MDFEPSRRNVEIDITRAPESSRQEMERIMDQKMAVLRNQLEVSQNIAPPLEEQANTQTSLQAISEKLHNLQVCLKNLEVSREQDLQILREEMEDRITKAKKSWTKDCLIEMENKLENIVDIVDINITRALESTQQKAEKILSEKVAVLQNQLEVSQNVYREELILLENKLEDIVDIVDIDITRALESTQQKAEKILSEKLTEFQNQLEVSQNVYREELISLESKLEDIVDIVDIDITRALESTQQKAEKILSEKLTEFQNQLEVSQNVYREELISLESKLEDIVDIVDIDITRALESTQQKAEKILSEKLTEFQNQLEVSQNVYREELISLESKLEFFIIQIYKVDISLDADTAHPRLEVSEDGKSVKDAGMIRKVPMREKRIDSHLFVLAKEGYTSGRFYWEVNVGKRRNWILGVAQESVTRKGTVALSPNNGFWVIGLVDGQEYWAYMDPWTHLAVTGTLQKIGIFLDISTKQLSFYNVHKKTILHAFTIADDSMQEGKLIPIFSTGSASAKTDLEPLSLV